MPRPPIDPDSFDKVNFVIDSWTTGCDAPWYIYIETMKPALLAAFITLITFGWDDVLRGYLRPRGLHPRRTGKRKGKWSRRVPRFPELGDLIGSNIPGAEEVKGKRWSTPMKTLWRIDSAMQAIMFAWLVVEVAEDFAFEWTSLLYESYWCLPDPPGNYNLRWKRGGPLMRAAWDRFAVGQKFVGRNSYMGKNLKATRGEADMALYIGSPGAKGGLPPTSLILATVASLGIEATITAPAAPDGWSLTSGIATCLKDQTPQATVTDVVEEGEQVALPGDVDFTGLDAVDYYVQAWLKWAKPDGSIAYGASISATILVTV